MIKVRKDYRDQSVSKYQSVSNVSKCIKVYHKKKEKKKKKLVAKCIKVYQSKLSVIKVYHGKKQKKTFSDQSVSRKKNK